MSFMYFKAKLSFIPIMFLLYGYPPRQPLSIFPPFFGGRGGYTMHNTPPSEAIPPIPERSRSPKKISLHVINILVLVNLSRIC